MPSTPDLLYIDVLLLSYRLGRVRHGEERAALLAAAQAAHDSIGFMQALENFGITRGSRLHHLVGQFLAAPSYYRNHYSTILGIPEEGTARESFLSNVKVLYLVEPVLTDKQQKFFFDAYWWFSGNHEYTYDDKKKGHVIGVYATEPKDNASTLARFEDYLTRLQNHKTQLMRERWKDFPIGIVLAILRRTFLS